MAGLRVTYLRRGHTIEQIVNYRRSNTTTTVSQNTQEEKRGCIRRKSCVVNARSTGGRSIASLNDISVWLPTTKYKLFRVA